MSKISKTRVFTKNALMDAFWQLYKNHEIKKITIKKITDKAGYNRITFYEYFENIYDVLNSIEAKIILEMEQKIENSLGDAQNITAEAFTERMVSLCNEYEKYNLRLFSENGDKAFEEKLHNLLKRLLKKYLKDSTNINNKYILEFYSSGFIGSIRMWYRNGCDMPIETFLNTMYSVTQI
ncbi:UNVERIFIED_CONTAM: AcrR family transcriptional regulator [Acetivibrio alkalicellulosi]